MTAAVSLEERVKARAREMGFDPVGITRLGPATTYDAFARWLEQGYAGEMTYLARGAEKRRDTTLPFAGVRSAVVVALNYGGKQPHGSIARYARGREFQRERDAVHPGADPRHGRKRRQEGGRENAAARGGFVDQCGDRYGRGRADHRSGALGGRAHDIMPQRTTVNSSSR